MKNSQENKLAMYLVVDGVCEKYNDVWNALVPFKNAVEGFTGYCAQIQELAREQENGSEAATKKKAQSRFEAVEAAHEIISVLKAHAAISSNFQLQSKVDYTKSELLRGREVIAIERMQIVHDTASENAEALAAYGITAERITAFKEQIDEYRDLITAPREAIGSRKAATEELAETFTKADDVLNNQLDNLIVIYKATHPNFVSEYQNARNIIDRNNPANDESDEEENETERDEAPSA